MIVLSLICLMTGAGSVAASLFVPSRRSILESVGGNLLTVGLILVGAGLPLLR